VNRRGAAQARRAARARRGVDAAAQRQEAERRRIEAQGIADFQRIVSQGIDERLLRWKGIEATQKLAESQNAKVVIVGAGKDGLPVILGSQ
jgi:regulator of protease activity HflC (stomatin/prohibitin superfamily)